MSDLTQLIRELNEMSADSGTPAEVHTRENSSNRKCYVNNSRIYTTKRAQNFLNSAEGTEAYIHLTNMEKDPEYKTESSYSPTSEGGVLTFMDKHMNYLSTHKNVNAMQYVSNLKLITKIRL